MEMIGAYLLKALLFQVIPGLALGTVIARKWPDWPLPVSISLGLGIAPITGIWLVNLAMLLIPGLSANVHVVLASLPLVVFGVWSLRLSAWTEWKRLGQKLGGLKSGLLVIVLLLVALAAVFYAYKKPVSEHDAFEYLALGKQLSIDRSIVYQEQPYFENTGFYYVGRHAFAYPLNFTLELMSDSVLGQSNTLYFRAFSSYYLLLLAALLFGIMRRYFNTHAILFTLLFLLNYGLIFNALQFHLDSARIFFLLATVWMLLQLPGNPDRKHYWAFGIALGLQSYLHSIGAIFAGIEFLAVGGLFYYKKQFSAIRMAEVGALALVMGGYHYVLDTFWGTGWVF